MIDYSSSWLASNYILMTVNLILAIAIKLLVLGTALKLSSIVQSGEHFKNPIESNFLIKINFLI